MDNIDEAIIEYSKISRFTTPELKKELVSQRFQIETQNLILRLNSLVKGGYLKYHRYLNEYSRPKTKKSEVK